MILYIYVYVYDIMYLKTNIHPKSLEAWILYLVEGTALNINYVLNIENQVKVKPLKECIVKDGTVPS